MNNTPNKDKSPPQTPKTLTFLTLNCAQLESTTLAILNKANPQNKIVAILLQQFWTTSAGIPPTCPNFDLFYSGTPARCCTYTRKSANRRPSNNLTLNNYFLGLNVTLQNSKFTLYNIYSPGGPIIVAELLNHLKPERDSLMIGDFNGHNEQWHDPLAADFPDRMMNDTASTYIICKWLTRNLFNLQNTVEIAIHFLFNGNPTSIIDFCWTSWWITTHSLHWHIEENHESDHTTTIFSIAVISPLVKAFWAWHRADWERFQ